LSRKTGLVSLLIMGAVAVSCASAGDTELLPSSSLYQGHQYFSEYAGEPGWLNGRIDFAVYDTETYPDEFVGADGLDMPGTGRYVYAYQVFNDVFSDQSIASFSVLNLDGSSIVGASGTGAQDDGQGGISPVDSDTEGVWRWELSNGGYIDQLEHSWILAFSSSMNWVPGTYDIRAPGESDIPTPGDAPEPATVLLIGLGSLIFIHRQRRSFK